MVLLSDAKIVGVRKLSELHQIRYSMDHGLGGVPDLSPQLDCTALGLREAVGWGGERRLGSLGTLRETWRPEGNLDDPGGY